MEAELSEKNRALYNKWAKSYDDYENSTVYVDEIYFPKHFLAYPQCEVLEIGCGTGRHTQKLAKIGHNISALDLSENMLQIAKSRLANYPKINFYNGDILDKDFLKKSGIGNKEFDIIILALVLEHIENIELLFKVLANLLSVGGRVIISDIHHSRMMAGSGARIKEDGEEIRGSSFIHPSQNVINAAKVSGLMLYENSIVYGTTELAKIKPEWIKYSNKPMIEIWGFLKK